MRHRLPDLSIWRRRCFGQRPPLTTRFSRPGPNLSGSHQSMLRVGLAQDENRHAARAARFAPPAWQDQELLPSQPGKGPTFGDE
jgi:hypothetical protein